MDNKITLTVLAQMLSGRTGRTRKECEEVLRSFFQTVSQTLSAGEAVKVKGFGTFKVSRVEARRSVDVSTGQDNEIPAHSRIVFLPAKELAAVVNRPFEMFETIELSDTIDDSQIAYTDEEEEYAETVPDPETAASEPDMTDSTSGTTSEVAPESESESASEVTSEVTSESALAANVQHEPLITVAEEVPVVATDSTVASDSYEIEGDDTETEEVADGASESADITEKEPESAGITTEKISGARRRFRNGFIWGIVAALAVLAAGASLAYMLNKDFSQKVNVVLGYAPADVPLAKSDAVAAGEEARNAEALAARVTDEIDRLNTGEKGSSDLDIGIDDKDSTGEEVPTQPSDKPVYDTITATSALGTMARKHYGNYHFWPYIYKENEKILGHPDRIRPGTRVVIPPLSKYGVNPKKPEDIAKAKRLDAEIYARYKK